MPSVVKELNKFIGYPITAISVLINKLIHKILNSWREKKIRVLQN